MRCSLVLAHKIKINNNKKNYFTFYLYNTKKDRPIKIQDDGLAS
jgi:hypothetical protein